MNIEHILLIQAYCKEKEFIFMQYGNGNGWVVLLLEWWQW
jgi:hypothetical protein